ncbi:16638_t:CDS:1, partial [Dentiscutata heterogama]
MQCCWQVNPSKRPSANLLKNILNILMNYRRAKIDNADERAKYIISQFLEADSELLPPVKGLHHPEAYRISRCFPKLKKSKSSENFDSQG